MAVWFETGGASLEGVDRLVTTAKYSIIEDLPISQRQQILAVDGVQAVTHQSWFGGNYQDPSNFFPKFPVEPRAYFEMYPEMLIEPGRTRSLRANPHRHRRVGELDGEIRLERGRQDPNRGRYLPNA